MFEGKTCRRANRDAWKSRDAIKEMRRDEETWRESKAKQSNAMMMEVCKRCDEVVLLSR